MTVLGGLQFRIERVSEFIDDSFNTDDGIRRAAISIAPPASFKQPAVSIPMTVLGGLQLLCVCRS